MKTKNTKTPTDHDILTELGIRMAKTIRPYNGRQKAIERAFLDQGKDYSRKAVAR